MKTESNSHTFSWQGKVRTLFKRGETAAAPWYIRLRSQGGDKWMNLDTTNRTDAEARAKDLLRGEGTDRREAVREALRQRKPANLTRLGAVIEALEKAPLNASASSIKYYVWALQKIVETVHGKQIHWKDHPVGLLTESLVHAYKQKVIEAQDEEEGDLVQDQRTANSILRQARAVFSRDAMAHYRLSKELEIPELKGFLQSPGFRGVRKLNYEPAGDELLNRTFEALEAGRHEHRDRYLTCWLALGFGLRKAEIAAVRSDWFMALGGRVHLELRATTNREWTENLVTKNGQVAPRIPVANGAWQRIGAEIESLPPGEYVIKGSKTYRVDLIFREVNDWMRALGWRTQKGIHELRAYAGCQICNVNGLLAGSEWLRHQSAHTTQTYYGRYIRSQVEDRPIPHGVDGCYRAATFPATGGSVLDGVIWTPSKQDRAGQSETLVMSK